MANTEMLKKMLEEEGGDVSLMRVVFALFPTGVLVFWMIVNIINMIKASGQFELVDIPQNVLLVLGSLTAGKVTQKFAEKKKEN